MGSLEEGFAKKLCLEIRSRDENFAGNIRDVLV